MADGADGFRVHCASPRWLGVHCRLDVGMAAQQRCRIRHINWCARRVCLPAVGTRPGRSGSALNRVKRGQLLGRVGNSGDSHWPHLHCQVTTTPGLMDSEGAPFVIDQYRMKAADKDWETRTRTRARRRNNRANWGADDSPALPQLYSICRAVRSASSRPASRSTRYSDMSMPAEMPPDVTTLPWSIQRRAAYTRTCGNIWRNCSMSSQCVVASFPFNSPACASSSLTRGRV
jgi:hypothetical protein